MNNCHLYSVLLESLLTVSFLVFISPFSLPFLPFILVITLLLLCYHSLPLGCLLEGHEMRRKEQEMVTSQGKKKPLLLGIVPRTSYS